jgi:hypothetical protein
MITHMSMGEFYHHIMQLHGQVIIQNGRKHTALPITTPRYISGIGTQVIELDKPSWMGVLQKHIWHINEQKSAPIIEVGTRFHICSHGWFQSWHTYGDRSGHYMLLNKGVIVTRADFENIRARRNTIKDPEQAVVQSITPIQLDLGL